MTDTDPEMMRRQQNMDTPQTIEGDGRTGPSDLDARDGRDRLRALGGAPADASSQQDAVFAQNARGGRAGEGDRIPPGRRRAGGLVRRGRSLLGS